jgi:hypothetical protein
MPASEARVAANRRNSQASTGPKTDEGKEKSRANSLKHGLTGAGIVLLAADAAEINRRTEVFAEELGVIGEVGVALVKRAALHSVRMERGADQQAASMRAHVRRAEEEFVAPEGATEAEAAALKAEAMRAAMFDPSKEAALARRYEMDSERGFYRAIKQLRQMAREDQALLKADDEAQGDDLLASFLRDRDVERAMLADLQAMEAKYGVPREILAANSTRTPQTPSGVDVPITVGKGG